MELAPQYSLCSKLSLSSVVVTMAEDSSPSSSRPAVVTIVVLYFGLNIGLNDASLLHLSLSFNQVIRASIPVVCAICAVFVENKVPTPSEAMGLLFVALGVMAGSIPGSIHTRAQLAHTHTRAPRSCMSLLTPMYYVTTLFFNLTIAEY